VVNKNNPTTTKNTSRMKRKSSLSIIEKAIKIIMGCDISRGEEE
jgi:hypothetical protein